MFVEIYKLGEAAREPDQSPDEWRWRLCDAEGDVLAIGQKGYRRRGDAKKAWERVQQSAAVGTLRIVEVL